MDEATPPQDRYRDSRGRADRRLHPCPNQIQIQAHSRQHNERAALHGRISRAGGSMAEESAAMDQRAAHRSPVAASEADRWFGYGKAMEDRSSGYASLPQAIAAGHAWHAVQHRATARRVGTTVL